MIKGSRSNTPKVAIITLLAIAAYNAVLFLVAGFEDHGTLFWLSYGFMNLAVLASIITGILLMDRTVWPRDWLFGYPFYKHCTIYVIIEFILSVIFMMSDTGSDEGWKLGLIVQMLVFVAFAVLITSCFMAKDIIDGVRKDVKVSTAFIKMLRIDVQTITDSIADANVKSAFNKLLEEVKYSDPVSDERLADVENRLYAQVNEARACLACNDNVGALNCCKNAMLLLSERNQKCKIFK